MSRRIGDRRTRPRFEIVGDLSGIVDLHASMTVRDLAPGGALLASSLPLPVDAELSLVAVIDGEPCPVPVRVRHCRPLGVDGRTHLVGIEFVVLPVALSHWIAGALEVGPALEAEA